MPKNTILVSATDGAIRIVAPGADRAAELFKRIVPPAAEQALQRRHGEWRSFITSLELDYGVNGKRLEALMLDSLEALCSGADLARGERAVKLVDQLRQIWPGSDETGRAYLKRLAGRARKELSRVRKVATSARFEPGRRGRRLRPPRPDATWAEVMEREPKWRNPTDWPWLGDRIYDVAKFLARSIPAEKGRGLRHGRRELRNRIYAKRVLELTAKSINLFYSRFLFHDLHFTPEMVKARLAKRKSAR